MKLFLGVDGGQSSTRAVIGDETGRVLGTGRGGPCDHAGAAEGRARLERAITESVGAACASAGLVSDVHFAAACLGLSGGPHEKEAIVAALVHAGQLVVTTDAEIALAGATESGQGIIVIAGTGSIALGRNAGRVARAGGWGYIFGDEGGAFDIVRQAVRAALRMEEGWGPSTSLHRVLIEATESRDANEAMHRFYRPEWPRDRVAGMAPLVNDAAAAGDRVALSILNDAAQQLATFAASVRSQLWQSGEPVEIAFTGGVFGSDRLRERFRMLVELEDGARCDPPKYPPAEGALREAYRLAGVVPPNSN